jgi:CRISPR-associated endoribonuclease Cas6
MRINYQFTPGNHSIPFDYQQELVRHFHRLLPENSIHDELSLYSLSWLMGGKAESGNLIFPKSAKWFISFYDDALAKEFLVQTLKIPKFPFGMRISDVQIEDTPLFGSSHRLQLASPVLARQFDGTTIKHRIFSEPEANEVLTNTLQTKLRSVGISDNVSVKFDTDYVGAKTKLVKIKNIQNRASMCPVIIEGTPESIGFAWNVGIGHCTGSGFGAVC